VGRRLVVLQQQTGTVHDRQRPGRPRGTTARADRFITLTHLRQRQLAATVTARQYGDSGQIIRNRLRRNAQPMRPLSCSQGHHSILAAKQCQRHAMARVYRNSTLLSTYGISWAAKHELTIRLTMLTILHERYIRNGGICPAYLYCVTLRRCGVGSLYAFVQMVATLGTNEIDWMCHISY